MQRLLLLHLIAAGCVAAGCAGAPGPDAVDLAGQDQVVQRDVEAMTNAIFAGDIDVLLDYTHPLLVEELGGVAKAREAIDAATKPMLAKGSRIESLRFPEPPVFVRTQRAVYALVPTLSLLSFGDERVESLNYQFGVLEPGASRWKYLEGSRVNGGNVHSLFPDFPADHVFPRFHRKRIWSRPADDRR